jgi:NOL1/NOP2/sun family putative RNA methylase
MALPSGFLDRLQRIVPSSHVGRVRQAVRTALPTTLRMNTLRTSLQAGRAVLRGAGFQYDTVPWYDAACIVRRGRLRDLAAHELYRSGACYVQSLSSMVPPLVLDVVSGQEVLDVTAAPGSKTTQLASLMDNTGHIVANDNHALRVEKLRANIQKQGATCVETLCSQGTTLWRRYTPRFDRVLVDAPCSSEGRFTLDDPTTYRSWSERNIRAHAREQKRLLFAGWHVLRSGGILVYSTCTLAPEENEGVISWLLERFPDTVEMLPCTLPIRNRQQPLRAFDGTRYHTAVQQAMRILPSETMEGFFVAKLRKKRTEKDA